MVHQVVRRSSGSHSCPIGKLPKLEYVEAFCCSVKVVYQILVQSLQLPLPFQAVRPPLVTQSLAFLLASVQPGWLGHPLGTQGWAFQLVRDVLAHSRLPCNRQENDPSTSFFQFFVSFASLPNIVQSGSQSTSRGVYQLQYIETQRWVIQFYIPLGPHRPKIGFSSLKFAILDASFYPYPTNLRITNPNISDSPNPAVKSNVCCDLPIA